LLQLGNTFAVYGSEEGTEKILPFDIISRIINSKDWQVIERGLKQRIFTRFTYDPGATTTTTPVKGTVLGGGRHQLRVAVEVIRMDCGIGKSGRWEIGWCG
jgi:hypothetical protein